MFKAIVYRPGINLLGHRQLMNAAKSLEWTTVNQSLLQTVKMDESMDCIPHFVFQLCHVFTPNSTLQSKHELQNAVQ